MTKQKANWFKWTPVMDLYLKQHYQECGDKQLAEMFIDVFPKHYSWTKKHIEKSRSYLKLKRTLEQVTQIRCKNNGDGRQYKMWDTRGRMKEGEIREWKGRKYIKINGKAVQYFRYITNAKKGDVVRTHEGEVRIIDKRENQLLNAKARAGRPSPLRDTIKILNQLTKTIKEYEKHK